MEIHLSNTEKSDEVIWDQDLGHARSYTCSFCKRGFSNAQALGGHMNIHRKDRAKLKEFSSENNLSLDITKKAAPARYPSFEHDEPWQLLESSDGTPKRPCTSPGEFDPDTGYSKLDAFEDELQLTLSIETSSSRNEKEERSSRVGTGRHVKRGMQLISHGASQRELDLELRLGPEPDQEETKK